MYGYDLQHTPFFINPKTKVQLFKGNLRADGRSIVVKRHEISFSWNLQSLSELPRTISSGLAQALLEHPNICQVLEIRIDLTSHKNCFVDYVMECLDKDLRQEIEERRERIRPFREEELWKLTLQVSSALEAVHGAVSHM